MNHKVTLSSSRVVLSLMFVSVLLLCCVLSAFAGTPAPGAKNSAPAVAQLRNMARNPLYFEQNRGQAASNVRFLSRGSGRLLTLSPGEIAIRLNSRQSKPALSADGQYTPAVVKSALLRTTFIGANPQAAIVGEEPLPTKVRYMVGKDSSKWKTDIQTFAKVRYRDVYPGIDLLYYGNADHLEYDFVVQPGTDPSSIRLAVAGASKIDELKSGDLALRTESGDVMLRRPFVYQMKNGVRREVAGNFVVRDQNKIEFRLGDYDRTLALVVDPVLTYASYFGKGTDDVDGIAVDSRNDAYIMGETESPGLALGSVADSTCGTDGNCNSGRWDIYIAHVKANGTLDLVTYLGGSADDYSIYGGGIAVNQYDHVLVTGTTTSTDFPITQNAVQGSCPNCSTYGGGAFAAMLSPNLDQLVYSTYLAGNGVTTGMRIAPLGGASGSAFVVAGATEATDFPTTVDAISHSRTGGIDTFITAIDPFASPTQGTGSNTLLYSTYLGGHGVNQPFLVKVDAGKLYVAGLTTSSDFPVVGVTQPALPSGFFASTNGGADWTSYNNGNPNKSLGCIIADPANVNILYGCAAGQGGVVSSTDHGANWSHHSSALGNALVNTLAADPATSGKLFAATNRGLFMSTDGAMTWTKLPTPGPNFNFRAVVVANGVVLAGTYNNLVNSGQLIRSLDGGATWQIVTPGGGAEVGWIAAAPSLPGTYYAAFANTGMPNIVPGGVYKSTDNGATWTATSTSSLSKMFVDSTGAIWATGRNLRKSVDGGATFTTIAGNTVFGTPPNGDNLTLWVAFDPANSQKIYTLTNLGGIWQTSDGGTTWSKLSSFPAPQPKAMIVDSTGTLMVAAVAGSDAFVFKYDTQTSQVVFSRTWGGAGQENVTAATVDNTGAFIVAGATNSFDLPLKNAYQQQLAGTTGVNDAFIVRFTPDGTDTTFATYFGGASVEALYGLATDAENNIYIGGSTYGAINGAATQDALFSAAPGNGDAFLEKFGRYGSLLYGTYFGGASGYDEITALAVDSIGNIWFAGDTTSTDLPTVNPSQATFDGSVNPNGNDAFFARLDFTADLGVTLDPGWSLEPGATTTFSIPVTNWGPNAALNPSLTINYGALTMTSLTPPAGWSCTQGSGSATCTTASLAAAPGSAVLFDISLTTATPGMYQVTAYVGSSSSDPNPENNYTSANISFYAVSDLAATMTHTPEPTSLGSQTTFTTVVTNNGANSAVGANLMQKFDGTVIVDSATTSVGTTCDVQNSTFIMCPLGDMAPGASATITVAATPTTDGTLATYAEARSASPDANGSDNTVTHPFTVTSSSVWNQTNHGRDFWFAVPASTEYYSNISVIISSVVPVRGTISSGNGTMMKTFSIDVGGGGFTEVLLDPSFQQLNATGISNAAIHVTATDDITVNVLNWSSYLSEGFTALPTPALGTNHYAVTLQGSGAFFGVVATQDATTVTLTPNAYTSLPTSSVSLNRGQVYFYEAANADLSGVQVQSNNPVAVVSGNACASNPFYLSGCGYVVEQIPATIGKSYVTLDTMGRSSTLIKVVPTMADTTVKGADGSPITFHEAVVGNPTTTLQPGHAYELAASNAMQFDASAPILVAQMEPSPSADSTEFRPNMTVITPRETWSPTWSVSTPEYEYYDRFIEIVAPAAAQDGSVYLDGSSVGTFMPAGPGFSIAQVSVGYGLHQVSAPYPVTVAAYGHWYQNTFAYPAGYNFKPLVVAGNLTLTGDSSAVAGQQYCATATLTDNAIPVSGVNVTFYVQGANHTGGYATTDANGNATLCYTGYEGGPDSMVATYGPLTSSAQTVSWTPVADLSIGTDTPQRVAVNTPFTFYVYASNWGPSTAQSVQSQVVFDSNVTVQKVVNGSCGTSAPITCESNAASLPSGMSQTMSVTLAAANTGYMSYTVSTADGAGTSDPNNSNNSSTGNISVEAGADIAVSITPDKTVANLQSEQVQYTINVVNNGPTPVTNATVTLTSDGGMELYSTSGQPQGDCYGDSFTLTCSSTTLPATFTVTAQPLRSGITDVTAYGEASSGDPDPLPSNNKAVATVRITPSATAVEGYVITDRTTSKIRAFRATDDSENPVNIGNAGAGAYSATLSPSGRLAYVTNLNSRFVSLMDLTLGTEVSRLEDIRSQMVTLSKDGQFLYIPTMDQDRVDIYDTITHEWWDSFYLNSYANDDPSMYGDIKIAPAAEANGRLFFNNLSYNMPMIMIDTNYYDVSTVAGTDQGNAVASHSIASTPDGQWVVAARQNPNKLLLVQNPVEASPMLSKEMLLSAPPTAVAIAKSNGALFAYVTAGMQLLKIDMNPASPTFFQTIAQAPLSFASNAWDVAVSMDGSTAWVISNRSDLARVDTSTMTAVALPSPGTRLRSITAGFVDTAVPTTAPTVTSISPTVIPSGMESTVDIYGTNFTPDSKVNVAGLGGTYAYYFDANHLQLSVPPDAPIMSGRDVVVTNVDYYATPNTAWQSGILKGAATVTPPPGFQNSNALLVSNMTSANVGLYYNNLISRIASGHDIQGIALTPDYNSVYAGALVERAIVGSNVQTGQRTFTLPLQGSPGQNQTLVIRPYALGSHQPVAYFMAAYFNSTSNTYDDQFMVLDVDKSSPTYQTVVKTVPMGFNDSTQLEGGITATSDGRYVYTNTVGTTPRVMAINVATGAVNAVPASESGLADMTFNLFVTSDDHYLLGEAPDGGLVVFDIGTDPMQPKFLHKITEYSSGGGYSTAGRGGAKRQPKNAAKHPAVAQLLPESPYNYYFNFDNFLVKDGTLYGFDSTTMEVIAMKFDPANMSFVTLGRSRLYDQQNLLSAPLAISDDGKQLYVGLETKNQVAVLDTDVLKTTMYSGEPSLARFMTDITPTALAVAPASIIPGTDLQASITSSPEPGNAGQPMAFTVSATNAGPIAEDLVVADFELPAQFQFTDSPDGCTASYQMVHCSVGNLGVGATASRTFNAISYVGGSFKVPVKVSGSHPELAPADNTAWAYPTVTGCALPPNFSKLWTGGDTTAPQDWANSANWQPAGAPTNGDYVFICQSMNPPVVSSTGAVAAAVRVEQGGTLQLAGSDLDVWGNAEIVGQVTGSGWLRMKQNAYAFGSIENLSLDNGNSVWLSGNLSASNIDLPSGNLDVQQYTLNVSNMLSTSNGGMLSMYDFHGMANVHHAYLNGYSEMYQLQGGTMNIDYRLEGSAIGSAASHLTRFVYNGTSAVELIGSSDVYLANVELALGYGNRLMNRQNLHVQGNFLTHDGSMFYSAPLDTGLPQLKLFVDGSLSASNLDLVNTGLYFDGGQFDLYNSKIENYDSTVDQIVFNTAGMFTISGVNFMGAASSGGHYISASDPYPYDGLPLVVNVTNSSTADSLQTVATSNGATINWNVNPIPTVSKVQFTTAAGGTTLVVNGTGFIPQTVIEWDGIMLETQYVSANEVHAFLPTEYMYSGSNSVVAMNPGPGGGYSNSFTVSLTTGNYHLTQLTPGSVAAGTAGFSLAITGTGFKSGVQVLLNGTPRPTTFVSSTLVQATISSVDIGTSGTAVIQVKGAAGTSNALNLTITAGPKDPPAVSTFEPANATPGAAGLNLVLKGNNFTANSVVQVNGQDRPTTWVSYNEIHATIPGSDLVPGSNVNVTIVDKVTGKTSVVAAYKIADFGTELPLSSITMRKSDTQQVDITLSAKNGSFDSDVSFTCSGLPSGANCTFSPATVKPGAATASTKMTISFGTTTGANRTNGALMLAMGGLGCFGLLMAGPRRKGLRLALLIGVLVLMSIWMVGCGGGAGGGSSPAPPTSTTTPYTVTVTASSGTLQHNITFTLNLQQ